MKRVLVVDDERSVRDSLKMILEYEKYEVFLAENGQEALQLLRERTLDAVLLDVKMPGLDGIEVLTKIRTLGPSVPVIMISGHGTIETAVEATKLGAYDFLQKPLDREKVLVTLRNALAHAALTRENEQLRLHLEGERKILGTSRAIQAILETIQQIAPTEARVLITGENGTGKELVARAIHRASKRAHGPFVEINCAAIPSELIESELFGHEKGAFTGAISQRIGKFEQADGGTLFLDEVGDMSLQAQSKVLRALEESTIQRVGGSTLIPVNVRVIAATNKNLEEEIRKRTFREDLYHRLNVIPIVVPPLRERKEDIPLLARAFVEEVCRRNGLPQKVLREEVINALITRDWPGNVRELKNAIERLIILSRGNEITIDSIVSYGTVGYKHSSDSQSGFDMNCTFQEFKDKAEAAYIKYQLEKHQWNITKTARAMDIQRSHLYTKMKQYGLMKEGIEDQE
ncbi:MAG: sigma-54 dependent transcriptional regulator [Bacteroidetes bacterium]|nr:sigma-54 dependent transcriptional regulator [Bacteroidota bacterium]